MKDWIKFGLGFSILLLFIFVGVSYYEAQRCEEQRAEFAQLYGQDEADKLMCIFSFPPRPAHGVPWAVLGFGLGCLIFVVKKWMNF